MGAFGSKLKFNRGIFKIEQRCRDKDKDTDEKIRSQKDVDYPLPATKDVQSKKVVGHPFVRAIALHQPVCRQGCRAVVGFGRHQLGGGGEGLLGPYFSQCRGGGAGALCREGIHRGRRKPHGGVASTSRRRSTSASNSCAPMATATSASCHHRSSSDRRAGRRRA